MSRSRSLSLLAAIAIAMAASSASGAPVAAAASAGVADLTVTSADARLQRGRIRGTAVVRNGGRGAAGASTLAISWQAAERGARHRLGQGPVRGFAAETARPVTFTLAVPSGRSGRIRIVVCADATGRLRERNERNNCRAAGTVTLPKAKQDAKPPAATSLSAAEPPAPSAPPASASTPPAEEPVVVPPVVVPPVVVPPVVDPPIVEPEAVPLPVVRIATEGAAPILDRETYVQGSFTVDPNGTTATAYTGTTEIRGRGNATWLAPKKPYRVKLTKTAPLLGLPSSRHWALLANYYDRSKQRNGLAFGLGDATRLAWTPRSRWVEVVLNGQPQGLYQLTEHVRIDKDRVNIDAMKPADISGTAVTGGYLLERDFRLDLGVEQGFVTATAKQPMALKEPEGAQPQQLAYIRDYVDAFEAVLFSSGFADPVDGYAKYIDVDSFVDWFLVTEFARNLDAWRASVFLHKPRSGKLTLGPLWDFDMSMGGMLIQVGEEAGPPEGWWLRTESPWFARLFDDPAFDAAVKARWKALRPAIDALSVAAADNGRRLYGAIGADDLLWDRADTRRQELADLKAWLSRRTAWLDQQFGYAAP